MHLKTTALALVVCCAWASSARAQDAVTRYYANKKQATQSIGEYLNDYFDSKKYYGKGAYDFTKIGEPESRYRARDFQIAYPFAKAAIGPHEFDAKVADPFLPDGAGFLLKKVNGRWKVLAMGTSLQGDGKKFGVPKRLWEKWGL